MSLIDGRYEIVRPLGSGSFGRTYLARAAGRAVALKRLDTRGASDWKARELFDREASVLRTLRHQGVPEIYDCFTADWDGVPASFLAMEFVEGSSLALMIEERRPIEQAEVTHLFLELLGVLDYLHTRVPPILHRDIKPSNIIMRPDGAPVLVDFGSVRHEFRAPDESGSTVAGTYGYMPYEQYMGQASPSSDLFALGATFLHLITGRAPREFMNDEGRLQVPDGLPGDPRLREVIERMLRPSPAQRFESARDARRALLAPLPADAASPGTAVARPMRAGVAVVALAAAPREIEGATAELLERITPTMWEYADTSAKRGHDYGAWDVVTFTFFSVITLGILPMVFHSMQRSRRRRLEPFFREGIPATARVISTRQDETAFGAKIAQVSYEFEADGATYRDRDQALPTIADRWRPGDSIEILYLPGRDYDSVIVSTR